MNTKKLIQDIINYIVNHGYIDDSREGEAYYVIRITDSGEWEIEEVDRDTPAKIEYKLHEVTIPLTQYEDEAFVEDLKSSLALELAFILNEWENHKKRIKQIESGKEGGKKAATNMTPEQRKQRAFKAVQAREAKKKQTNTRCG